MSEPRLIGLSGIYCPACGGCNSGVVDKRNKDGYLRRRRKCSACGHLFTTKEQLVPDAARGKHSMTESDSIVNQLHTTRNDLQKALESMNKIVGDLSE